MGERKVLNKYYPPDFDPEILPRNKKPKDQQIKVRTMLPMSIQCNTCGEYLYKGKKFNAKKETCIGETYLGIEIYRFYIRCTNCSQEITFKTDPKRADYECEHGASRNFEPWREADDTAEEARRKREEEDEDSMKALENKTIDNRREMDILDGLDEMKSLKARRETITFEQLLEANLSRKEELAEEDIVGEDGLSERDRREMREAFQKQREKVMRIEEGQKKKEEKKEIKEEKEGGGGGVWGAGGGDLTRKRIMDESKREGAKKKARYGGVVVKKKGGVVVKKKEEVKEEKKEEVKEEKKEEVKKEEEKGEEEEEEGGGGLFGLMGYGSSDSE